MNTTIKLTDNEIRAIKTTLNYHNRECELNDNATFLDEKRIAEVLGWNKHQVAGLFSSMQKKGLLWEHIGFDEKWVKRGRTITLKLVDVVYYCLTPDGINAYFDAIEN